MSIWSDFMNNPPLLIQLPMDWNIDILYYNRASIYTLSLPNLVSNLPLLIQVQIDLHFNIWYCVEFFSVFTNSNFKLSTQNNSYGNICLIIIIMCHL